jgi:hypothetical protein
MTQKFMTSTKEAGGPTKDIGRIGQWAYGTLNGRRWDETRQDKEYRDTVKKKNCLFFQTFQWKEMAIHNLIYCWGYCICKY